MSWLDGWTKNWAVLDPEADDPALRPVRVDLPPERAVAWAADVLARRRRWAVIAADPGTGTLHATHRTRVWRFVDDVHLRFEPDPAGTRISARSRSRIGQGDLGQNARNLRDLTRALRAAAARLDPAEVGKVR